MKLWIAVLLGFALLLLAFIVVAAGSGGGSQALDFLTTHPWGRAVTADLYLGFFVFGALVYRLEHSFRIALAWTLPTLVLGNLVPVVYAIRTLRAISST